jgi:hypothetical protein
MQSFFIVISFIYMILKSVSKLPDISEI